MSTSHYRMPPSRTLVLAGYGGVGKSALASQFASARFPESYEPTLIDVHRKSCVVDGESEVVDVVEASGIDSFQGALEDSAYTKGDGFLIVFALDDRESLLAAKRYMHDIMAAKGRDCVPAVLVGNKSDITAARTVSQDEARSVAADLRCKYVETSARSRHNVDEAFFILIREIRAATRGIRRALSASPKDDRPPSRSSSLRSSGDEQAHDLSSEHSVETRHSAKKDACIIQ